MKLNKLTLEAGNSVRVTLLPTGRAVVELEEVDIQSIPKDDLDRTYDVRSVAERLATSPRQILALMRQDKNPLPYFKLGRSTRFRESDLQMWIDSGLSAAARRCRARLLAAA
jgi:predicted DNA-binding transcriptional regulator AlpA